MQNLNDRETRDERDAHRIRRRSIVGGLASMVAASPLRGQTRVYRVGVITSVPPLPTGSVFVAALAELGYREGQNLVIERRIIMGHPERLPQAAKDLVSRGVDVVLVETDGAALAVKAASPTVPIVMAFALDPIGNGLAASLARPGGTVTGLTFDEGTDQATKRLQFFKEVVPGSTTIAALWDPTIPGMEKYWPKIHAASQALGIRVQPVGIRSADDVPPALEAFRKNRTGALWAWGGQSMDTQTQLVAEFAIAERLPLFSVSTFSVYLDGFLLAYSANLLEYYRRAASYVDRILKGAKPGELPFEQPSRFELAINLRTARAIGLTIPQQLLLRADRVIQ